MRSPSYGCFSTGMRDDNIEWQEAPLGYSAP